MKNKKSFMIIFGLIMWPIIIATPQVVNTYLIKLGKSEIAFGEIPMAELISGLFAGLFGALLFIGLSYLLAYIISLIKKSSMINGPVIFFIATCLLTVLFVSSYGKKVIDVLSLEKENVEMMQQRIKGVMKKPPNIKRFKIK
jgi:hypothetical protein